MIMFRASFLVIVVVFMLRRPAACMLSSMSTRNQQQERKAFASRPRAHANGAGELQHPLPRETPCGSRLVSTVVAAWSYVFLLCLFFTRGLEARVVPVSLLRLPLFFRYLAYPHFIYVSRLDECCRGVETTRKCIDSLGGRSCGVKSLGKEEFIRRWTALFSDSFCRAHDTKKKGEGGVLYSPRD